MSVKIVYEVGHIASLKSKTTVEGFTHDWELFLRGIDNNNITRIIDKVVFNLHESFPKPKRAIKEPPYVLKESGYAGFNLPIDIYFKGPTRDDPKKISIIYDLNLQHTPVHNVEKFEYTFNNPAPDFRRKLIEAGGIPVNSMGQMDEKSRDATDERSQLTSKPKLGSSESKKHKNRPMPDEPKPSSTFANLFGTPITKISSLKVSPDQKNNVGNGNSGNSKLSSSSSSSSSKQPSQKSAEKLSSKDKAEKSSRDKKDKSKRNSPGKDSAGGGKDSSLKKVGGHDGREEKRKDKNHAKERDRSRDKSQKRPTSPKHLSRSPKRSPSRSSNKESQLIQKREEEKPCSSSTKKSKKEKRDKDKDRERLNQKREKESKHQSKDREERSLSKTKEKSDVRRDGRSNTPKDVVKDKLSKMSNDAKSAEMSYDHSMADFKSSSDTKKSERSEKDSERKHKHKKKDKHKEKDRSGSKEHKKDKDKLQKQKGFTDNSHVGATSGIKSSSSNSLTMIAPMAAPISKLNPHPLDAMLDELPDSDSSNSDMDSSSVSPVQIASKNSTSDKPNVLDALSHDHIDSGLSDVITSKHSMSTSLHASPHSPLLIPEYSGVKSNDKASKRAAKEAKAAEKEEKKRKRKAREESQSSEEKRHSTPSPSLNGPPPKLAKKDESYRMQVNNDDNELSPQPAIASNHVTSSSPSTSNAVYNDNFPSSSPSIATSSMAVEVHLSPIHTIPIEYMIELKELQNKIMALDDNNELQQVVEMIAATGCYEITTKTFDFDLCALDRITVQRLQEYFDHSESLL